MAPDRHLGCIGIKIKTELDGEMLTHFRTTHLVHERLEPWSILDAVKGEISGLGDLRKILVDALESLRSNKLRNKNVIARLLLQGRCVEFLKVQNGHVDPLYFQTFNFARLN